VTRVHVATVHRRLRTRRVVQPPDTHHQQRHCYYAAVLIGRTIRRSISQSVRDKFLASLLLSFRFLRLFFLFPPLRFLPFSLYFIPFHQAAVSLKFIFNPSKRCGYQSTPLRCAIRGTSTCIYSKQNSHKFDNDNATYPILRLNKSLQCSPVVWVDGDGARFLLTEICD